MGRWYQEYVQDPGRAGLLFLFLAFAVTFAITRWITRRIRAQQTAGGGAGAGTSADDVGGGGLIKDIHIGGVHVHHQVWGILLMLSSAILEFAYQPESPWLEILGALFGVGAALTLDEFALWFHLDDVYWSDEGRKSIDAVVITACLVVVLLLGSTPLGIDTAQAQGETGFGPLAAVVLVNGGCAIICILKGKLLTGLVGIFVPFVAIVGAMRIGKPTSAWARRRYRGHPWKMAKSEHRFSPERMARWDRWRERLGGKFA